MNPAPTVLVDTREQRTLPITAYPVEVATLPVGDYGIADFSDWTNPAFIVERKSLDDLIGSLTHGRERFMREVEKLRQFRFRAVLVEVHATELELGHYRSGATPKSMQATIAAMQVRTNLHFIWAGDAEGAARALERLVRQFCRGIEKDARRLSKATQRAAHAAEEAECQN